MEPEQFLDVAEFGAKLDWLTFTSHSEPEQAGEFHRFARNYMQREQSRWSEVKERKIGGYVGLTVNESSWLRRDYDKHEMLVASGETANRLAEEVIIHGVAGKATRIDARVTARLTRPDWTYPERIRAAIHSARAEKGNKRRKKVALFDSDFGNSGLTIGSRSSTRYVRIYDHNAKHCSSADATIWAHEGEYKAEASQAFFNGYSNSSNRAAYCAGVMRNTLTSMNVPCDWLKDVEEVGIVVGRKITTAEKRLAYAKKISVPMLVQLVAEGQADAVRDLLISHNLHKLFDVGGYQLPE